MEVCRKCGAPLRDTDKYCSKCGARAPSERARLRRERAERKKQQKTITFRTKPEKGPSYRENFEEGENRVRALRGTVTVLLVMMLAVAAFAAYSYFSRHPLQLKRPDLWTSAVTESLTENEVSQAAQQETDTSSDAAAAPQEESGKEGQGEEAPEQSDAPPQSETQKETVPETERQTPKAADVIDAGRIQEIIASQSSASAAEVYIYDLKHDSEVSVNDCNEQMYLSAIITVPILYTAASRMDAGELSPDTPVTYVTSIGGRGEMTTELRDGLDFPLSFYLQTMANYSDNNCINILIDFLGLDSINSVCQSAGYSSIRMERGLVAGDTGGLDNYGSAKDITMMVRDLYTGKFSSIGPEFMRNYFHISEGDSLPTLIGTAPGLSEGAVVLNQNGHGSTRYNETAVVSDSGAEYIITVMLYGNAELLYNTAVTEISEYVNSVMK